MSVCGGQLCPVWYLFSCLLFGSKGRMSLLPQELSCPQEGLGMFELPSLKRRRRREDKFVNRKKRCTGQMWEAEIVDEGAVKVPEGGY